MKTTVDIADPILSRAKVYARKSGRPLRALVEEGLRLVLEAQGAGPDYELPDLSVGAADDADPLERLSWQDLREHIYGGP